MTMISNRPVPHYEALSLLPVFHLGPKDCRITSLDQRQRLDVNGSVRTALSYHPSPQQHSTIRDSSVAIFACVLVLSSAAITARSGVVAENLNASGVATPTFWGQSFTTGPAAEYAGLSFNFYTINVTPASGPHANADFTYLLLSKEYLGTNRDLNTSTPGFIAKTTGVSGNQWVFDHSVTLLGNTRYWLYGSSSIEGIPTGSQLALGHYYSGGRSYHSGAGAGSAFTPQSGLVMGVQTEWDLAFTINSKPKSLLDVLYGVPVVDTGPLSLGLHELPAQPQPTFSLSDGTPLAGGSTGYRLVDVLSAELLFGDGVSTDLTEFYLEVDANGGVDALSYTFAAIDTSTAEGVIAMNGVISMNGYIGMDGIVITELPFSVTGTDLISGEAFSYTYASAELMHPVLPDPTRSLLDVLYDTPVIHSGSLSFGLSELPAEPHPTFSLGEGTPLGEGAAAYGLPDVVSARLIFGDATFRNLTAFDMEVDGNGLVTSLSYTFAAIDTPTAEGSIVMNFPLTITGTDIASGEAFSYTYASSTATIAPVLESTPLGFSSMDLTGDTLTLTIDNIPSGQTFHLRQSIDLTNFEPASPPIDITDTTPQPLAIPIAPTTKPKVFFTVGAGSSPDEP